jgi:ADP-ribosylglycohydrolase
MTRVIPLGIAGHNWSARKLAAAAMADAKLTNPHRVCQGANAALVMAIAHGIREACSAEEVFTHTVAGAKALELHPAVITALESAAEAPAAADVPQTGPSTLQTAFHELLYADSLANGVMGVAEMGGEAGTNAAVTGALLGAVHGYHAIPPTWVRKAVTSRPVPGLDGVTRPRPRSLWCVDALVLAEQLFAMGEHT